MKEIKEFLEELLDSQELTDDQEKLLQSHKNEVTDYLRQEFGEDPIIKYAGSREKGTMIRDCYDLDIVCYFPNSDERTLKEIRDDVATHLSEEYLLKAKSSAERILDMKGATTPSTYHIDVVPGRFIKDTNDVFIHLAAADKERLQTNLKTHIDFISNSGCVPVIRLVKLWALRNNIQLKTFILELFVVTILADSSTKSDVQQSFLDVLEGFKDKFETIQLIDPANTNNIVSKSLTDSEKTAISKIAEEAFDALSDEDDVKAWETVFEEDSIKTVNINHDATQSAIVTLTPRAPWSN